MGPLNPVVYWYDDNFGHLEGAPFFFFCTLVAFSLVTVAGVLWLGLFIAAPLPRIPFKSEKMYRTILPSGDVSKPKQLPCWVDRWRAERFDAVRSGKEIEKEAIEDAEVFVSVVVPAYNEEERLKGMLEEAVDFLQREYNPASGSSNTNKVTKAAGKKNKQAPISNGGTTQGNKTAPGGWEIIIVSDGSTDKTEEVALAFAKDHQLRHHPHKFEGPWKDSAHDAEIPHGSIRVVQLETNRGKGGAVIHGMRHVRGAYAVFADADGASKFEDLAALIKASQGVEDSEERAVAIGSRAHLVGSDAVVKRSKLRNFLMHSFHLFIRLLTTRKTAAIKDTQCGFKLFSRASLPYIIPNMHSEGWIFDVEMLMLAESARIPMIEVPIGWKEVPGSKLNVLKDSISMAFGLAILRICWIVGIYSRS